MTAQQRRFANAAKVCKRSGSRAARNRCMSKQLRGGRGRRSFRDLDQDEFGPGDYDAGGSSTYGSPMGRRHRGGKRRSYRGRHGGTVLYR